MAIRRVPTEFLFFFPSERSEINIQNVMTFMKKTPENKQIPGVCTATMAIERRLYCDCLGSVGVCTAF
jgi:hypothetical protein